MPRSVFCERPGERSTGRACAHGWRSSLLQRTTCVRISCAANARRPAAYVSCGADALTHSTNDRGLVRAAASFHRSLAVRFFRSFFFAFFSFFRFRFRACAAASFAAASAAASAVCAAGGDAAGPCGHTSGTGSPVALETPLQMTHAAPACGCCAGGGSGGPASATAGPFAARIDVGLGTSSAVPFSVLGCGSVLVVP